MTLEMPDVEKTEQKTKGRTDAEKKAAQAEAHRRWRQSPKGQAYRLKQKCKDAGVKVDEPTSGS